MTFNERGMTAIELIISLALFAGVLFTGATIMSSFQSYFSEIEKEVDQNIEKDLATRYLLKDLQSAQLSFNFINQKDDRNLGFFDFWPQRISSTTDTRTLTLSKDSRIREIFFLITDPEKSIPYPYFPHKAYQIQAPSPLIHITREVKYIGVNRGNAVSNLSPGLWANGNWLLLYTPVWYPETSTLLPRQLRYLGYVNQQNLPRSFRLDYYNKDPLKQNQTVTTADQFFRRLPAVGGGAPVVFVQKVRVISYRVETETVKGIEYSTLNRYNWGPSTEEKILVARDVKSVTFRRNSIHTRVISVDVEAAD